MDDPSIIDVGGFAAPGYTSGQVLANIEAAPDADVLVIMVGTNDVRLGVDPYTTRDNIDAIAAKVGAARVLLVGTPPINSTNYRGIDRRTKGYVLNRYLIKIAAYRGWMYADPFANYRGYNNAWLSGRSADGTHPTAAASAYAAARMETYIRQTFEGAS
jgi:lysophospholipase L1-like esterase